MLSELCSTIWFDNRSLSSSRKQGGAAERLIDGSEKRIFRSSFEFWSPHVIKKCSNVPSDFMLLQLEMSASLIRGLPLEAKLQAFL